MLNIQEGIAQLGMGGLRTAKRVLNIQEGIAQLRMHRVTMLEIAPSTPATKNSYGVDAIVRRAPSSQEGARQSEGHRTAMRTPIWRERLDGQELDQEPPEAIGEIPFRILEPIGNLEFSAPK